MGKDGWGVAKTMQDHGRMERLRSFGLSEYASRAYLALLELGTTEARDVSRLARVPIAKVYSTLGQLQERGLVVVIPDTPRKYAPVPFNEFIERLRAEREEEARQLAECADELASLFPIVGSTEMNDRGTISTVRGRPNVLQKFRDCSAGVQNDLLLVATRGTIQRASALRGALEQAAKRGARVRIVAPIAQDTLQAARAIVPLASVRARPATTGQAIHVSVAIFDGRSALMAHHIPDDHSLYQGKDLGLYVDEAGLTAALAGFAEAAWEDARPLDDAFPPGGPRATPLHPL